jgi:hypothetical protein
VSRASRYQTARQAAPPLPEGELVTMRMTPRTRELILAGLEEAATANRDRSQGCDHEGDPCESCAYREASAAEYEAAAGIVAGAGGPEPDADEPVPEEEGQATAGPEDANPLRAAWTEASDRYDELLAQQDADPDAPLGQRITAAYYARQDAAGYGGPDIIECLQGHRDCPEPGHFEMACPSPAARQGRAAIEADREAGQ